MKQNINFFIFLNIGILALLSNYLGIITRLSYIYNLLIILLFQIFVNIILIRKEKLILKTDFETKDLTFYFILTLILVNKIFIPDNIYDTNNYHIYLQQENVTSDLNYNLLPGKVLNNYLFPLGDKMHYIFRYLLGFRLGTLLSYYVIVVMFYQLKNILNILMKDNKYTSYMSIGILCSYILYIFISSYYVDSLGLAFVLEILYMLIKNDNILNNRKLLFYLALLTGLSIAIKLPNIFLIIPIILFYSFKHRKEFKIKYLLFYILCILIAIVPMLPYCINNYVQTGSPLFPYYNNIFKSDYYSETYFKDYRFGMPSFLHALIWPIYTSVIHLGYGDDWMIRDLIWAIGYTVSILTLVLSFILNKTKFKIPKKITNISILSIILTFFWIIFLYGYMRYALIIPIVYYILICMILNEIISSKNTLLKIITLFNNFIIVIALVMCNYYILSILVLIFIMYSSINLVSKNTKILDITFICIFALFTFIFTYNLLTEYLNNPIQRNNIIYALKDRNIPTIEIDGVWGVIGDDSAITTIVRNASTPIYNLDKENYTSEKALDLYNEKVLNTDKNIYVLIDSYNEINQLYYLENNGFEITEIIEEYDIDTLHFLEASNIVQLLKVKYVGID